MQFSVLADRWRETVLPMYKTSTRKNHSHILEKHLDPRFGHMEVSALTPQVLQAYIAYLTAKSMLRKPSITSTTCSAQSSGPV